MPIFQKNAQVTIAVAGKAVLGIKHLHRVFFRSSFPALSVAQAFCLLNGKSQRAKNSQSHRKEDPPDFFRSYKLAGIYFIRQKRCDFQSAMLMYLRMLYYSVIQPKKKSTKG